MKWSTGKSCVGGNTVSKLIASSLLIGTGSYQYNAFGTCPGGLIEGIADWVRLNAHLSPPHWKKEATGNWDAGYQHTGYFLEYLEQRFGKGTIRKMNEKLRIQKYEEKRFWTELLGRPVEQ
jgi:hypothetical protein